MSIAAPPAQYVVTWSTSRPQRPDHSVLVTEDMDEALAQVRLIVDAGGLATAAKMRAEL